MELKNKSVTLLRDVGKDRNGDDGCDRGFRVSSTH